MPRPPKPAGPSPTETTLREAALRHLARYATTRSGLIAVLDRRIARWLRASDNPETAAETAPTARQAARIVADKLVALGLINDAAFAENRARTLTRAGRSRRAVAAHLATRGISPETAQSALPNTPETERAAAIAHARRRRLGPFRTIQTDPARLQKELATFARAGFSREIAMQTLHMDRETAEALLHAGREE